MLAQEIAGKVFQSTLPRGERLHGAGVVPVIVPISIHAPTRGATGLPLRVDLRARYFNPRSHEGSDRSRMTSTTAGRHFNPRSHEGSDDFRDAGHLVIAEISIHAPTRGATLKVKAASVAVSISIHAPTRGATVTLGIYTRGLNISIHAPTRGATVTCRYIIWIRSDFNPRSHEGSDAIDLA